MHFKATLLLKVSLSLPLTETNTRKRSITNGRLEHRTMQICQNLPSRHGRYFYSQLWHCTSAHYLTLDPLFYMTTSFYRIPPRVSRPLSGYGYTIHRPEVTKTVYAWFNTVPRVFECSAIPMHRR